MGTLCVMLGIYSSWHFIDIHNQNLIMTGQCLCHFDLNNGHGRHSLPALYGGDFT